VINNGYAVQLFVFFSHLTISIIGEIPTGLSGTEVDRTQHERFQLKPVPAALFSFLAVYLSPYFFSGDISNSSVTAFGWILNASPSAFSFYLLNMTEMVQLLLINGVFLLMPLQVWRFYHGRTTMKRVMLVGALGWAPYLFVMFMTVLPSFWDPYYPYRGLLGVPVPISLILVYLMSRLSPPPLDTTGQWLQESPSPHA